MLNGTYEHLREDNKQIASLYDQYDVYEAKIGAILTDRTLSGGARSAKAYDQYIEASAIGTKLTDKLLTSASLGIDKLHNDFIGSIQMSVTDAIAIAKEVKELPISEQYETLKASAPARQAVSTYEKTMGRGGINDLVTTLEDVFIDTNRVELTKLDTLKNASVALEQSFKENLQVIFPSFLEAEAIAESRV